MIDAAEDKTLWAIVTIGKELFAIRLQDIQTMVALPPVTALPRAPACVRGVMNLRGSVVPVVDLRKRLGMVPLPTEIDDLITMLNRREEDHKNWLTELEFRSGTNGISGLRQIPINAFSVNGTIISKQTN